MHDPIQSQASDIRALMKQMGERARAAASALAIATPEAKRHALETAAQ